MEDLIQKNESLLPDKKDTFSYVHPNEKKLPHTSELHTEKQFPNNYSNHGEKNASNFTKIDDFQKLSQEVSMLKVFEDKVDGQFVDMKKFMRASFLKILEELMTQLIALEPEATHVTPIKQVCKKALGKYAQSPYTDLIDSCGTS
ncbi:hypothetical protein H5410_036752 [Solanum commersonii]|uniref:Uncharacterized protein n=1 Tax=Solanum commersonii TaxID=4109 RepID=A0A9J5Y7G8_SOLCO|nr:hypothetical protein H5410_036752 [Solanum commersonii]